MNALQRTPLYDAHRAQGARLVPFAGFEMPVQYTGIKAEHAAVRQHAGLFDVSHMGQIHLQGPGAIATTERLVSCPVASLRVGRVRYGLLCNTEGGVVDDVTVYRTGTSSVFLCVNAANVEKDQRWIESHMGAGTQLHNRSAETALLALQGPESRAILAKLGFAGGDLETLRRFRFAEGALAGHPVLASRTGYTGSDGFEIYTASGDAEPLWKSLVNAGATPCGLGARDTLRLEAALSLYGHELDDTTSPLEARLDRFVKLEAGGFLGADAIRRRRDAGHSRLLAGFILEERGVARAEYPIASGGREVGVVTSGGPSPSLGKSIGLGYVPPALARPGCRLDVVVRGRPIPARVVDTPFVGATRA